jgi:protein-S-isoprenylcysteine O-methyltransferase Ste14
MRLPRKDWIFEKLSTFRGFSYLLPIGLMAIISYKETEDELTIWPLGIGIVVLGASIRLWGTKHIGRRMPWVKKKEKILVKTGPYAMVRNPLYIGNLFIAAGLSIVSELIWMVPFVILYLFIFYHLVVLHEEKKLSERWGEEYAAYMREVPRWIPRLHHLQRAKGGGFEWRDALRSEIPSFYVNGLAVLIFVVKEILSDIR